MSRQIQRNRINTIVVIVVFIVFISLIGALFAWLYNNISIFVWFFVISAAYALFQYFAAAKLALSSSGARAVGPKEAPRLYRIVEPLAQNAKIPMPQVYIVNDSAPNAFATGRDPSHAHIAATTGLLEIMDDNELRAVIGHELSHVKNYDIRINMIVFGLVALVGFIADFGLRIVFYGDNLRRNNERGASPIGAVFVLIAAVLSPIAASLIQMAVSRQREYLADMSSAHLLGRSDDMINALRKLDSHARPMQQQNVASESLYIANPLRPSILSHLFSTHPPIEARIERLENVKK
ncbi:M48 family metalloprotease [Candidatus Saccharibacteria bacterium]|nr:M48 family metalloprotease [Candidatus Saccharibacteria bacterium]